MKVNLNVPLIDYKGKVLKDKSGKDVTAADKVTEALYFAEGNNMDKEQKLKAYRLLKRISHAGDSVELDSEEKVMIKDLCAACLVSGAYGQIAEIIEGKEE